MLTEEIADEIVKETSLRIKRNVNIMNTKGRIIASIDKARIDTIHEGAKKVIQTGKSMSINQTKTPEWKGVQPGINLPILFKGNVIGVIGVTGNPQEMGDIGELVKMTTELMINQEFIASQFEWKQRMKEMVIEQLLRKSSSMGEVDRGLSILELEFKPPYLGVIIEFNKQIFQKKDVIHLVEEFMGTDNTIAAFISVYKLHIAICRVEESMLLQEINKLRGVLQKLNLNPRIAYSLPFDSIADFHQAYIDCHLALDVSDEAVVSFANIEVEGLIRQMDEKLTARFAQRVLNKMDEIKQANLQTFFDQGLNIQKAADALFVHRNTLIYRLNRITEITGYNPKVFHDALILQVALWICKDMGAGSKQNRPNHNG